MTSPSYNHDPCDVTFSACFTGYDPTESCQACSDGYYRLGGYCTLCPPTVLARYLFPLQYSLYLSALIVFCLSFDKIIKISSISIFIRFIQTTYLLLFFDMSWQGTFKGLFVESNGIAAPPYYNTLIFDLEYFPTFKAVSLWMPMFFFPDFKQMSVEKCAGSSPMFKVLSPYTYAWVAPVGFWIFGWLGWAVRHGPPIMQTLTKFTTLFEGNRRRRAVRLESVDHSERVVTGQKDLHRHYGLGVGLALLLAPYFSREFLAYLTCEWNPVLKTTVCSAASSYLTGLNVACFILAVLGLGVVFLLDPRKDGPYLYLCKGKTKRRKKWEFFVR